MTPSLTAPPAPHSFLSRVASASSAWADSGRPVTTETPLPLRPAVSRPTRTRAGAAEPLGARALRRAAGSVFTTTPRKVCVGFIWVPSVHSSALRRQGSRVLVPRSLPPQGGRPFEVEGVLAAAVAHKQQWSVACGFEHL